MASQRQTIPERPSELLQSASTFAWSIYLNLLEPLVHAVVPEPTRRNFQRLVKDANNSKIIKDKEFLIHHFKALRPLTLQGWLALLAAIFFSYVGIASLAVCLLGFSTVAVFCLGLFLASLGISVSIIIGLVTFFLFASTFIMAGAASSAVVGYMSIAASQATLRIVLTAVERTTGMTLHDKRLVQAPQASHLDVISEGDEEGHDSDNETAAVVAPHVQPPADADEHSVAAGSLGPPRDLPAGTSSQPSSTSRASGTAHASGTPPASGSVNASRTRAAGSANAATQQGLSQGGPDPEVHFQGRRHVPGGLEAADGSQAPEPAEAASSTGLVGDRWWSPQGGASSNRAAGSAVKGPS